MFDCCKKKKPRARTIPQEVVEIPEPKPNEWEPIKPGDTLITNGAGIALIMESEGFHKLVYFDEIVENGDEVAFAAPYLDPIGLPTIGYGTIAYPTGEKVTMNDKPIRKHEAIQYLRYEIDEKENVIHQFLKKNKIYLGNNEFAALVSFAYNVGAGPIISNGWTLNRTLKSGDRQAIANAFLLYDKATKKFGPFRRKVTLRGLTIRRQAERKLFLTPEA